MEYSSISQKIKALRNRQQLSIQELAERANLTPGYLSKIENSEKPPPIPTLVKIASALNVHIAYFFDGDDLSSDISIVRKHERKEIIGDLTQVGYRYEATIQRRTENDMNPFVVTLPDDVVPEGIPYSSHNGEELIYVLEGDLIFHYGDDTYHITEGDCLHFNTIVPHRVVRTTDKGNAKLLSILFFS